MRNVFVVLVVMLSLLGCAGQSASAPEIQTTKNGPPDSVGIKLSDVSTNVDHYIYDSNGVQIRYFIVKGSDGVVRTAFDACEVCYRSKKGYTQVGNDVKCNNCGLSFQIDGLGTKNKGTGCWPAYLPHEVQGDNVIIKKSDLEAGSYLFS